MYHLYKWLNMRHAFQWREMSMETFWMRPDVKRVMEMPLLCLYQTAVGLGMYQYNTIQYTDTSSCFINIQSQEVDQNLR